MSDSTFPIHEVKEERTPSLPRRAYIKDSLDLVFRRRWLLVSFVLLGLFVGGGLAWIHEDWYRSTTVIVVEPVKNLERSVSAVGKNAVADAVLARNRQVLSRTNLQSVIDQFHLSPDIVKSHGYESVIESLRDNITIETKVHAGQIEALAISFSHHDPTMAMKVTATLATQYTQENIGQRDRTLEEATESLDQELALAKKALEEKATELSEYNGRFFQVDTALPRQVLFVPLIAYSSKKYEFKRHSKAYILEWHWWKKRLASMSPIPRISGNVQMTLVKIHPSWNCLRQKKH